MNETLKLIKERFSCRNFSDRVPTGEELNLIAQAAIQSPSGMNRQHWEVIVITNKELLSELEQEGMKNLEKMDKDFYERIMSRTGNLFYNAPCMILISVKKAEPVGSEMVDLGIIAENVVIAATSLGFASLHCGLAGLAFAGDKREYFGDRLGFPEGYECGIGVLIGSAVNAGTPHEPDQSKITFVD